jgi:hypothetical protein
MPSLSYAGALLAAAIFLSAPVLAQSSAQSSAPKNARVQHVVVRDHVRDAAHDNSGAIEVEIQTSGAPIAPDTQAITGPDRIVVDFPGALPDAGLRALAVNRGALKGVRAGLFSSNPPITRVVLDLTEPQSYQISTIQNAIVVRVNPVRLDPAKLEPAKLSPDEINPAKPNQVAPSPAQGRANLDVGKPAAAAPVALKPGSVAKAAPKAIEIAAMPVAKLQSASLLQSTNPASTNASSTNAASMNVASPNVAASPVSAGVSPTAVAPLEASSPLPPMPFVSVTFVNGMLRIHAEKASLAEVLFEVHRQTQAEIAIPAGAEREQVLADLGPAPARDVLAALLNGSRYNFIFVGNELKLEQVILTLRQPNF